MNWRELSLCTSRWVTTWLTRIASAFFSMALADQLVVGHLAAEVEGLEPGVALQAVVAGVALHVEDGVDAHRVRVGAGAGAEHDDPPADLLLDERVEVVEAQLLDDDLGHVDLGVVDATCRVRA